MNTDQGILSQIANTLAAHYDVLYYIELESGNYTKFISTVVIEDLDMSLTGEDFYKTAIGNSPKYVHPEDLERELTLYDKDEIARRLNEERSYSMVYRLITSGKIVHVRQVYIMCDDGKHFLCCIENIEDEYQRQEEQRKNLQSVERMARLDKLTGIKNKNAFEEYMQGIDERMRNGEDLKFGIVVCDVNDLKLINDTRGHAFGDEVIQMTSRIICDIYKHSPVFRIGGDEFSVVLTGSDYENREQLLGTIREESEINGKTHTGPVIASGMSEYISDLDDNFDSVFERADELMYENKKSLKSANLSNDFRKVEEQKAITEDRKRLLDKLFGALYTIAGEGYVVLNDLRFDYSRWSLPMISDFDIESEYMYQADRVWHDLVHPEDIKAYDKAIEKLMSDNAEVIPMHYRARKSDGTYVLMHTRGFVLYDNQGNPDYFGAIILPQ